MTWNRSSWRDNKLIWIAGAFFNSTTLFKFEPCNTALTCLYYYFINHCIITSWASRWTGDTSTIKSSKSIDTFIADDFRRATRLKTTWATSQEGSWALRAWSCQYTLFVISWITFFYLAGAIVILSTWISMIFF